LVLTSNFDSIQPSGAAGAAALCSASTTSFEINAQ